MYVRADKYFTHTCIHGYILTYQHTCPGPSLRGTTVVGSAATESVAAQSDLGSEMMEADPSSMGLDSCQKGLRAEECESVHLGPEVLC